QIVYSVERNNPEVHLMVLLADERPEEVTDMRRHVQRGEVVASTFDRPSDEHTQVAELAIERAKRLVEMGKDVVIILDGITRLARAYNLAAPASGRSLSAAVGAPAAGSTCSSRSSRPPRATTSSSPRSPRRRPWARRPAGRFRRRPPLGSGHHESGAAERPEGRRRVPRRRVSAT